MKIDINKIKMNKENPRVIKDNKFKKLVKSIKDFPEMLEKRPLIIDENNVVLGGNMRLKALEHLKYKKVPVIQVKDWSEEKKKEFIIKDNVGFGEWDFDILANIWNKDLLNEWGLEVPDFYELPDMYELDEKKKEKSTNNKNYF
jgi:ParB-like chromosome segregation protein Spo0J